MAPLYIDNGKIIVKDNAVGISADCCCKTCYCEEYKSICVETVWSRYSTNYNPNLFNPGCEAEPINDQADGTIAVDGEFFVCGTNYGTQFCGTNNWAAACDFDGDLDPGEQVSFCQFYHRVRVVNSCEECSAGPAECCEDGVGGQCYEWADAPQPLKDLACNCADSSILCKDAQTQYVHTASEKPESIRSVTKVISEPLATELKQLLNRQFNMISTETLGGPGTELKKLLSKFGITSTSSCNCNAKARLMDNNEYKEPGWCEANIDTIVGWLKEEANKRKLPFVDFAARALIKRAIRNYHKNIIPQND